MGAPVVTAPDALPPAESGAAVVEVNGFVFEGMSLVAEDRLKELLQPYVGQRLTLQQINVAIQRVVGLYRGLGWLASVYLPPQEVKGGIIRVAVLEGKLKSIAMQGKGDPANIEFLRALMSNRLQVGAPVAIGDLERGLLLAEDIPGVAATGLIQPGTGPGEVKLLLSAEPKANSATSLEVRNWGGRATGEEQALASFEYYPNRGYGERLVVSALASEGIRSISAGLTGSVGNDGLRMGVSASHLQYKLIGDFEPLNALGESNQIGLNANAAQRGCQPASGGCCHPSRTA